MRFALSYKVVQDLRSYERNKLSVFIDDALKYWRELRPYLQKLFNPLPGPLIEQTYLSSPDLGPETLDEMWQMGFPTQAGYHRFISLFPQVSMLSMSHPWFRLTPETKAIIDGINGISAKIEPHLRKKEELGLVADCIERLSGYLYSLIHGIGGKPINDWGLAQLAAFAECVNALSSYQLERKKAADKSTSLKKAQTRVAIAARIFMHQNLLICFIAWYALFELLVVLAMVIAFKLVPDLKMDSVMVTSLIATPILGAAAVVAVSKARAG